MNISLQQDRLTICQLAPDAPIPAWALGKHAFCSITRTSDELSIVCPEHIVPPGVKQETGWRVFQADGLLDFALTGILV